LDEIKELLVGKSVAIAFSNKETMDEE